MPSSHYSGQTNHQACFLQYEKKQCDCGRVADVKIANTGMNPNKLFYTCKDRTCDFWDWAHPLNLNSCENGTKVSEVHMKLEQLNSNMEKEHKKFSKETADKIVGLKTSCGSIQASIETLENIVKLKVNGPSSNEDKISFVDPYLLNAQQRFNEDLSQIVSEHGFTEKDPMDEEVADVVASKTNSSTLVYKPPSLPERWLKANTTCNTKKSAKQITLITKSDLKKNSHFKLRESCMIVDGVTNTLFQTPPPKGTQAKCAKTSGKGQHSSSKDMTELTMTSHNNTKSLGCIVPKLEAKFSCKPTYDMLLAKRQPQVCAYLFQKTSDAKLMAEILVLAGKTEATRADLQCLIPTRVISDMMNENEVRMTTAANLLLGDHNALRYEVIKKTETFINKLADVKPIELGED
ncbi:unnamed protein product [Trifolium pratense]|uniref:Uncharacterized protein n=1 Tax=Trifolium pratense TaxID=57577 RepID=A0ACB0LZ96_TRIPR|nr:unnamed protein product [Trifolium pratense]